MAENITIDQATRMNEHVLQFLIEEQGMALLEQGIITIEDAIKINLGKEASKDIYQSYFDVMFSEKGKTVLKQQTMTTHEMVQLKSTILTQFLNSEAAIEVFTEKLILIEEVPALFEKPAFSFLLTKEGSNLLRNNVINKSELYDLSITKPQFDSLIEAILSKNGQEALKNRWIDLNQFCMFSAEQISTILANNILPVFKNHSPPFLKILFDHKSAFNFLVTQFDTGLPQFDMGRLYFIHENRRLATNLTTILKFASDRNDGYLEALLSREGQIAMREKLVSIEQVMNLPTADLQLLFTARNIDALRNRHFSLPDLIAYTYQINHTFISNWPLKKDHKTKLEQFLTESQENSQFITLLEFFQTNESTKNWHKFIQKEYTYPSDYTERFLQLCTLNKLSETGRLLLSTHGFDFLINGTLTLDIFKKLPVTHLKLLLNNPHGREALTNKTITEEGLKKIKNLPALHLELLLNNPHGHEALTQKIIAVEDLEKITNFSALKQLLSVNGIMALRTNLLTIGDFEKLPTTHLELLLDNLHGLEALTKKIITVAELEKIKNIPALEQLLSVNGIIALQSNLFRIDEFCNKTSTELGRIILSDECMLMLSSKEPNQRLSFTDAISLGEKKLGLILSKEGRAALTLTHQPSSTMATSASLISEATQAFFQQETLDNTTRTAVVGQQFTA